MQSPTAPQALNEAKRRMRRDLEAIFGNTVSENEKACKSKMNSLNCGIYSTDSLTRCFRTFKAHGITCIVIDLSLLKV